MSGRTGLPVTVANDAGCRTAYHESCTDINAGACPFRTNASDWHGNYKRGPYGVMMP